jgi:NADPH:quinone reductase-like Zn-dependent oxidoreductase
MKAIVYERYGSPDVLELREVEKPTPREGEVLVRVRAVSINDWDLGLLDGRSIVNRLLNGPWKPKRMILGSDIAGQIEAVGTNVTRFNPGDHVFGDLSGRWGGFAEYVSAPETALASKPESMTYVEAAAIPQAGMLAVQGLLDVGHIRAGQTVLINGAGGGVGTFALQIARLYTAKITGVDSAEKLELVRSLGADRVLDYKREDFTETGSRYDLILDVSSKRSPLALARPLNTGGVYVTVGGAIPRLLQLLAFKPYISLRSGKAMRLVRLKPNKDLEYMKELYDAGKVRPVIDGSRKLSEVPEALRHFAAGRHIGKIVITVD